MKLSNRKIHLPEYRIEAVNAYVSSGSLPDIASHFNVHPRTLRRWIKRYEKGGEDNLRRAISQKKHWRRWSIHVERKTVLLKEKNPGFTLLEAQDILKREEIVISLKGIWNIWKRYGLIGFMKDKTSLYFFENIAVTPAISYRTNEAEKVFAKGDTKQAAQIINLLPSCCRIDILKKIPRRFLSLPRQVEQLYGLFGKITFEELEKRARDLRKRAEKKGLLYLSVRIGIMEALALEWVQDPRRLIVLVRSLQNRLKNTKGMVHGDSPIRFALYTLEGKAWASLMQIKKALTCAQKCRQLLRSRSFSSEFKYLLSSLYISIGHHRQALDLLTRLAIETQNDPRYNIDLGTSLALAGEYRNALHILQRTQNLSEGIRSHLAIIRAVCSLATGNVFNAFDLVQCALTESQKKGFRNQFHMATLILGAGHAVLNENNESKKFLKKAMPLLRKFRMRRDLTVRQILLDEISCSDLKKDNITPLIQLALFLQSAQRSLKMKDYRRAFNYARARRIIAYFHLLLPFFPRCIQHIIAKGKSTNLPSQFLKLPVFQRNLPTYHLKFLGTTCLYRNGKPVHVHIPLKAATFLIHLATRKTGRMHLEPICRNFWSKSRNPKKNLSHLLVNLRKYLGIPEYLLHISRAEDTLCCSVHITTDYQYYEETLTQAKALERAGEWGFAKKEYLRAFKLFRGEPFKKMYDPWSEHMRRVILNELETEAVHFVRSCLEHNNEIRQKKRRTPKGVANAKKVLEKVSKIIPQSEEIEKMVREYGGPAALQATG